VWESVPQPHKKLPSIDPLTFANAGVVFQEVGSQAVQVSKGVGEGPGDLPVGVGLVQDVGGEGVHGGDPFGTL